ncbi:1-phosphatidylinositol 4,5-bisphosphate phosphodiesterase classes I and II-like protein [Anopheles sinensis]|uniref:1-phosphatidylinositol 4,5-bisphosphate phosphodiesterase classes I and II-like protein n=1 Tax=Anopheles sinensis TaxID=74873 RepID=A0A084VG82_ANOSI|nr:1-phosphatidylinositol 4,5-bisphosphate phosphodiesterase classes I and II-like protein [Anopheles sinensis]
MASMLSAGSATPGADGKQQQQQQSSPLTCSPRNAASGNVAAAAGGINSSQTPSPASMAVVMNNPTAVKLGVMDVPKALQDGEKFIKWDEPVLIGAVMVPSNFDWKLSSS